MNECSKAMTASSKSNVVFLIFADLIPDYRCDDLAIGNALRNTLTDLGSEARTLLSL